MALSVVPWKDIIKAAPPIVESSRKLYDSVRKKRKYSSPEASPESDSLLTLSDQITEIQARLNDLETNDESQAELTDQRITAWCQQIVNEFGLTTDA